jgi:hypothetical protein
MITGDAAKEIRCPLRSTLGKPLGMVKYVTDGVKVYVTITVLKNGRTVRTIHKTARWTKDDYWR